MKANFLLTSLFAAPGLSMGHLPVMCFSSPPIQLHAGVSLVSARIYNPLARRCTASLAFGDPNFLPVSYTFESAQCAGQQLASFLVPLGAPNGDAFVTWQCAGQSPTCSYANVSGGQASPSLDLNGKGSISCIVQALGTSTTLTTLTRGSSTIVETLLSAFTSVTTAPVTQTVAAPWTMSSALNSGTVSVTVPTFDSSGTQGTPTLTLPTPTLPTPTLPTLTLPTLTLTAPALPSSTASNVSTLSITSTPLAVVEQDVFPTASRGSSINPSVVAATVFSTITIMQTMTAFLTATCST
ncbi:hypothetical protein B0H63DRAFT_524939 [Podospora didyma]|uniref:Ig-like domain-containing protein n=1 Tax=Podospora didyma TaxID=330526 RepID=A0AAE0NCI9_9PEZI|nr:hypothetical protein B0H63DRAFT_524939 [Podospora didyma]